MSVLEDLADALARDVLALEQAGDEDIAEAVAKSVGASSPTMEEAYRTAIRFRRAESRGRALLEQRLAEFGVELETDTPEE